MRRTGSFSFALSVFFFFVGSLTAFALNPELHPPHTFPEVMGMPEPVVSALPLTEVYRVPTARVLVADYALIRHDFPQVKNLSEAQIDEWVLKQAGYLSKSQIKKGVPEHTNTEIPNLPADHKAALRPPEYNRALVLEVEGGGLIDGKGFGSETPALKTHANGLLETHAALREHFYTKAVHEVFVHEQVPYEVVNSYAVIDWGFEVFDHYQQKPHRAGAILRQAHVRGTEEDGVKTQGQLSRAENKKVEAILRKYGLSSGQSRQYEKEAWDILNLQGTKDGRFIFDFGSFRVASEFKNPAVWIVDFATKDPEKHKVFDPTHEHYPQPDPQLRFSAEQWTGKMAGEERISKVFEAEVNRLAQGKSVREVRLRLKKLMDEMIYARKAEWKETFHPTRGCLNVLQMVVPELN